MNRLKRKYHSDVTFVLGNHDVIVYGLNLLKKQKTKVVAYLLGENIKVYPDVKMIVIKIDSTSQGNLARGMVGQRLLQEIEDELLSINHLEDYTLIAMMHHHLMPLRKDDFLKIKWNEKLFMGKIADSTKAHCGCSRCNVLVRKTSCTLYFPWTQAYSLCCKKRKYVYYGRRFFLWRRYQRKKKQLFKL